MPTRVTFYHSAICPRCFVTRNLLSGLRAEFPEIEVDSVEYLTNLGRARADGVRGIPTLVSGDRVLAGFLLTRPAMRDFLASLGS